MVAESKAVRELASHLNNILRGRAKKKKIQVRRLKLTERNIQRVFGLSSWELFKALANHFEYEIEEEG